MARLRVAAGVVVGKNDGGGAIGDLASEDVTRVNRTMIEQADRDQSFLDDLVRAVERDADEVLLRLGGDVGHKR